MNNAPEIRPPKLIKVTLEDTDIFMTLFKRLSKYDNDNDYRNNLCILLQSFLDSHTKTLELRSNVSLARQIAPVFPMQNPPVSIPWSTAEIIYAGYFAICGAGCQTLIQLANRGGFSWIEVINIYTDFRGRKAIDQALQRQEPK